MKKVIIDNVETLGTRRIDFNEGGQFYTLRGLNPFLIDHGISTYQLQEIRIYDQSGVLYKTKGWFGSNNPHKSMKFLQGTKEQEVKMRRKERFNTDEVYIMSMKRDWSDTLTAVLYIPVIYL